MLLIIARIPSTMTYRKPMGVSLPRKDFKEMKINNLAFSLWCENETLNLKSGLPWHCRWMASIGNLVFFISATGTAMRKLTNFIWLHFCLSINVTLLETENNPILILFDIKWDRRKLWQDGQDQETEATEISGILAE